MSVESPSAWPVLSITERRVLGVLVEKQKTTDTYPLTPNSIVTGANQKSNRDPILNLTDDAVDEALESVQKKGLVMQVVSGRVDKWRHLLYETWKVTSVELAVLAELLLRGPQTEGELRGRASRMDEIADVDALRLVLKPLVERGLVIYLTPEGRRGTVLTHGFHDPQELAHLKAHAHSRVTEEPTFMAPPAANPVADSRVDELGGQMAALRSEVSGLRAQVETLAADLDRIRRELGITGPA